MAVSRNDVISALLPEEPNYRKAAELGAEALPHLARIIREGDPVLAPKAVSLVSHLVDRRVPDVLKAAAASGDPAIRVAAAASAKRLSPDAAAPILAVLMRDADEGVLKFALLSTPPDPVPELRAAVQRIRDDKRKSRFIRDRAERIAGPRPAG